MDLETYFRFLLALIFVIGLIALLALAARRFGFGYRMRARDGQARRLSISEIMPLDAKRRLVLLRRDDTEHLVILGPTSQTVVESGIPAAPQNFAAALADVHETNKDGASS